MNKKIIHTLIEQIALQSPARVAISYQHQTVSYQALNESANQVAHTLCEKGVGRGDVVGLLLAAGPDYIAALLGVLKAGAIFMPMAADAPFNRQQQILEKAAPEWIIAHDDSAQQLPDAAQEKVLLLTSCRNSACTNPELISVEDDGNYLLFTSGSTGTPKAILGRHKSLSHFIHWEIKELGLDDTVRTAFLAAPTFDVSLRDIFVPLLAGGMVCIPAPEVRSQSRLLLNWIVEQQITCLHCVPSLFRLLMQEMEAADRDNSSLALENVLLAGEAVYGRDVEQWRGLTDKRIALINVYGPSETTLAKLFHRVTEEYPPQAIIPIGQPISNTAVLILKNGRLCGIGEIGEIYIKTPFLTKGYYRDDALTQQVFVQNPLTDDPDIIYKTGDMGRYRADRSVEFLGRQDHQVKVNGIRIELGEIEQVLMQHASVRQAIVVARKNRDASYTLIAYYTLTQPGLSVTELREHTADYLSDSVLPAFFVEVERFKLNLHGKVDRKALPEPEAMLYEHSSYVEPRNETEADLARIWGQVLTLKQVGIHHTFIELGGDSLKAIRVASHIYRDMQIQISLKDFFQYPSIAELAEFIKDQQTTPYQAIPNVTEQAHYPCSHAQQRLWALQHMDADARAYNISGAYALRGECNVPALEAAIHQLLMRHEALRTGFMDYQGQPQQQVVADTNGFRLDHQAVSSDEQLQQLIAVSQTQTFRLDQVPLLRVSLLTLSPDEHVLAVNIHHLICDAWSLDIMLRELFVLYRGQLNNTSVELPALSISYKDFASWQRAQLQGNDGQQSREWWLAHFADIPEPLQLMTDKARPALQTFNGAAESMVLDAVLSNNLKQLARQQQVSLFALLSGLVRVLLYRYTGQADFVLGTAVAGRQHPDLDNQVGLYANTLAWCEQIHGGDSFNDVIQRTGQVLNDAFEHQSYPFDRLLQDLNLTQDMSRNPLFDVMVILQNAVTTELSLDNLAISAHDKDGDWESSRFDLTFHFSEAADGQIRLDLNYNTDLFSAARIQSNTRHFEVLATAVCDAQYINTPVSRLPLMTTEERELQLSGLNQRQQVLDSDQTLISLFTTQVQNNPQHPALRWHDQTLTYAELDEKSSHLAQVLRQQYALQNEERVAVSLNRGFNGIVSVLACLKAGVVYVPVDPAYPAERVNYLLSNSACKVLISEAALIPGLQACTTLSGVQIADIDTLPEVAIETDTSNEVITHPDQLAFVIHTSGSTGNPKGVMLEQRGFINMILDQIRHFGMQPHDAMLQFASPSFDASLYESFIALLSGATLVLIDRDTIEDTGLFTTYLDHQRVTTAVLPPVYVRALAQHPLPTLRNLMTIGEQAVVDDALFYAQGCRYFNGYGPSEGGICAAVYQVGQDKTYPQGIPVGQATANTRIYLLDNALQPVPQGYPGEIFIGGMGLARGYLNQTALTQEAFIADPFVAGERIYRSGDLGYRNRDGELCYAGRKDDQIKLAGHRIEPAEIAHWLRRHPTVQDALVLLEPEQNRLVAYVVPESVSVVPDAAALRHYLQQSLPAWMVPTLIQPLTAIPLTVNGKVNKAALPVAQLIQHATAPELRTEQEILLATVWSTVLGVDVIGPSDDYFALGGDSIKAIQISARLREQGYELRVQTLFRYPVLEQAALEMKPLLRNISQDAVAGELALAPVQHWYFELNNPEAHHFNQAVVLCSQQGFDQCCVKDAMEALWQHHDVLRAVYQRSDRGVQALNQPICALPAAGFECYDLRQESQPEPVFQQQLNHIHKQFDLANGPLFKAVLFRLPGEERLLLVAHHLVVDGVSWRILLEDFSTVYRLRLNQQPAVLPEKTDSYQYFTECLSTYAHRHALSHQTYWQNVEETCGDRLPATENEPHHAPVQGMASVQATLSPEETRHLSLSVHQAYNTHTEELLLVALALCLQQVYGISASKLAIENHGRQDMGGDIDVSRTVGWFTALYPFMLDLPDADTGYQIRFIKEAFRSIPQQGFDYGVLKYITRSLGRGTDAPQQIFNYLGEFDQSAPDDLWQPDWDNTGDVVSPEMPRQYVLEWLSYVSDGQLRLSLAYDTAYYSEDAAGQLLARYVAVLQELITHCMQQGGTDFSPSDLTFSDLTLEELDAVLEAN